MDSKTTLIHNTDFYSEEYKEACFFAWYRAGRPKTGVVSVLPRDKDGKRPSRGTIKQWREAYFWIERADVLDTQVSKALENEAIQERVETLRQLAKDGKTLKEKGLAYLEKNSPFDDNPSAAVRAVVAGSEMEFRYAGQAAVLQTIGQMSDKQVQSEIRKLLGGRENDVEPEIIDADEEDETADEIVDEVASAGEVVDEGTED